MSLRDCFQAVVEEREGFTKEVSTMWKVSVVEDEKCTVPKAGKKGIQKNVKGNLWLGRLWEYV